MFSKQVHQQRDWQKYHSQMTRSDRFGTPNSRWIYVHKCDETPPELVAYLETRRIYDFRGGQGHRGEFSRKAITRGSHGKQKRRRDGDVYNTIMALDGGKWYTLNQTNWAKWLADALGIDRKELATMLRSVNNLKRYEAGSNAVQTAVPQGKQPLDLRSKKGRQRNEPRLLPPRNTDELSDDTT
jgi:hypothetical protein